MTATWPPNGADHMNRENSDSGWPPALGDEVPQEVHPMATVWNTDLVDSSNGDRGGEDVSGAALTCASCLRGSRHCPSGTTWAVCRCGNMYCKICAGMGCATCGTRGTNEEDDGRIHSADQDRQDDGKDYLTGRSEHAVWNDTCDDLEVLPQAQVITPADAVRRRAALFVQARAARAAKRKEGRAVEKQQRAEGHRPKRHRARDRVVTIVTANVGGAGRLHQELTDGTMLSQVDYLAVQESRLDTEGLDEAASRLTKLGWSGVLDEAYLKHEGLGGGTGVVSKHPVGVRRAAAICESLKGRFSIGIANVNGPVAIGSMYCISGLNVEHQKLIWVKVAKILLALGIQFVLAADWQCSPAAVAAAGLPQLLSATICAPRSATNLNAGSKLDFFLVANTLIRDGYRVRPLWGCCFRPHVPILLELHMNARVPMVRRLRQPRLIPREPPIGPVPLGIAIDWSKWDGNARTYHCKDHGGKRDSEENSILHNVEYAMEEWFAGAEVELLNWQGLVDTEVESQFIGLGMPLRETEAPERGRFKHVPNELGILGHRMDWVIRGLNLYLAVGRAVVDRARARADGTEDRQEWPCRLQLRLRALRSVGYRAVAFRKEEQRADEDSAAFWPLVREGLTYLSHVVRSQHGVEATARAWIAGRGEDRIEAASGCLQRLTSALTRLANKRRSKAIAKTKAWVKQQGDHVGHRCTKMKDDASIKSASADKSHLGEGNDQEAADAGARDWNRIWMGKTKDESEIIMQLLEAIEAGTNAMPTIPLPQWCINRVKYIARRFRGGTATGADWLRLRHIAQLSKGALEALCRLFMAIESNARWPDQLRSVIEVALSKKTGGARLIGVAPSLYRLWARIRYLDIRIILEERIERPVLAAAPGRGAQGAALEATFTAEAAIARGWVAASTAVDISKYYEHISVAEYFAAALEVGIPRQLILLASHFYLGPRRIRVGGAFSRAIYPARGIVPGCTWCTVLIRVLALKP